LRTGRPYKTPAKEADPRHMPPNFYYDQEDYLIEQSGRKMWSWTALRPSCICGFAVGNPIVKRHNPLNYSFQEAVAWPFGEAIFNPEYDVMSDTTKSRKFGFYEWVDTEDILLRLFSQFQKMRFIP
jgi:hypothetical protein